MDEARKGVRLVRLSQSGPPGEQPDAGSGIEGDHQPTTTAGEGQPGLRLGGQFDAWHNRPVSSCTIAMSIGGSGWPSKRESVDARSIRKATLVPSGLTTPQQAGRRSGDSLVCPPLINRRWSVHADASS